MKIYKMKKNFDIDWIELKVSKRRTIIKDKLNNIIATYIKDNPIQETQLPKIIDGILDKLPKTK